MSRKASFTVIEIMEQATPELYMNNALKIVNNELTILVYLKSINYYLITLYLSFVRYLCAKHFTIKNAIIYNENISRFIKPEQKTNISLLIFDNGVNFYGLFIPYEHIIKFGFVDTKITLNVFINVEAKEKEIILRLGDKISSLSFDVDNSDISSKVIKTIKENMYYNIKFNKTNMKVVEYYIKKTS